MLVNLCAIFNVAAQDGEIRILALGDSLTAGFNLPQGEGWPDRMERVLKADGLNVRLINAGVSGDTSAGGRSRLGWALADDPQIAVVELGANDGLRGLDPKQTFDNLDAIVSELKAKGIKVLLTGMFAPPNLGKDYGAEFNGVFPALAKKHGVPFYPFFLDGVIGNNALMLNDGMHPNIDGVGVLVDRLKPHLMPLIDAVQAESGRAENGA